MPASVPRASPALAIGLFLAGLAGSLLLLRPGTFSGTFLGDDLWFLDAVRGRSLLAALRSPDPIGNYFRPVSRALYYWVLARAGGESPLAFQLANAGLAVLVVVLLFALIRRLAGTRAAALGSAFLATHYALDVPMSWAAGAQDLVAVAGILAVLLLQLDGRRGPAAGMLVLALFSKEIAVLTPALAMLLDRHPGERWLAPGTLRAAVRRALPLWVCTLAWLPLWFAAGARPMGTTGVKSPGLAGPPAALYHLIQVVPGIEWGATGSGVPRGPFALWFPIAIGIGAALAAPWLERRAGPARPRGAQPPLLAPAAALGTGLAWAVLAALPLAPAISFWNAFGYLLALCGVALALGAVLARVPSALAAAALALLALGSASARALDEVAIDYAPWVPLSHINRFSIERGMRWNARFVATLRAARPALPERSTLFVSGVPKYASVQQGNGALVRWAYRDSTLRSYYSSSFSSEKARRGPFFFFQLIGDSAAEVAGTPEGLRYLANGYLLNDAPDAARAALEYALAKHSEDRAARYWLAILEWEAGERERAAESLRRAGAAPDSGPAPEVPLALARLAAGDTLGAIRLAMQGVGRHALDPAAHALLADLTLPRPRERSSVAIEALACRVLAPGDAAAWKRWGKVQIALGRYEQARRSFDRYVVLGGSTAATDPEVQRWLSQIARVLPGGDVARAALRGGGGAR